MEESVDMDNQKPLISVIIPTYKRPTYLKRAINSVKSQTYENIEIIVGGASLPPKR